MKKQYLLLLFLSLSRLLFAQEYPSPKPVDNALYSKHLSRTMHLLNTSTSSQPHTVKILVYGQSITAADWWLDLKTFVEKSYPTVNLIMENRSIPGFTADRLVHHVRTDVLTFYPDLVIFHDYGNLQIYEEIIKTIRGNTIAEMAILTDLPNIINEEADKKSSTYFPEFAEKYHLEVVRVRDTWKQYLEDQSLKQDDLLKDGIHPNKQGEFLLTEIVKPYFNHHFPTQHDPEKLHQEIIIGQHANFNGDTLIIPFHGNKATVSWHAGSSEGSYEFFIDGKKPSTYQDSYFFSRPNPTNTYWPWNVPKPVPLKITNNSDLVVENWKLVVTKVTDPENFDFQLIGSVTGIDGTGNSQSDFTSNSGKVVIESAFWFKWDDKTGFNPHVGDTTKWHVNGLHNDQLQIDATKAQAGGKALIIQGISNTRHELMIIKKGVNALQQIELFHPALNRADTYTPLKNLPQELHFQTEGGQQKIILPSEGNWSAHTTDKSMEITIDANHAITINTEKNTGTAIKTSKVTLLNDQLGQLDIYTHQGYTDQKFSLPFQADTVYEAAANLSLSIEATDQWSVASSEPWLTVATQTYKGSANLPIKVAALPNDVTERTGIIYFTATGIGQDSVTIVQKTNPITRIGNIQSANSLLIYPNPSQGTLNFTQAIVNPNTAKKIAVYDQKGSLVFEQALQQNTILMPATLKAGLYEVQVIEKGVVLQSQKVILQR